MRTYKGLGIGNLVDVNFIKLQLKGTTIDFECVIYLNNPEVDVWHVNATANFNGHDYQTEYIDPPESMNHSQWFHPFRIGFRPFLDEDSSLHIFGYLLYKPLGEPSFHAKLERCW